MTSDFPSKEVIAETVAKMLLEIDAVHFNAERPFTFTSGIVSPVYIDCRKIISYPRVRDCPSSKPSLPSLLSVRRQSFPEC